MTDRRAAFAAIHDPPDLVIADAALAARNGYALLRRLRAHAATNWHSRHPAGGRTRRKRPARGARSRRRRLSAQAVRRARACCRGSGCISRWRASGARRARPSAPPSGGSPRCWRRSARRCTRSTATSASCSPTARRWNSGTGQADEILGRPLRRGVSRDRDRRAVSGLSAGRWQPGAPSISRRRAPAIGNRWVALDAYPAPDGGLVVAYRDIDDRKRAEAQLRQSEERCA